jgi:hypothetical protein
MNNQNNEPNLFIIATGEGANTQYYNGKHQYFTSDLAGATYANKNQEAQRIINYYKLANSRVIIVKESEYIFAKANAMTKLTIMAECVSMYLKETIEFLPNKSQVTKSAHKHLKLAAESIKGLNPDFEHFVKTHEDDVYDVQGYFDKFIHEVASIPFVDLLNVTAILQAYKIDEKSICGIAKKVIKHNEDKEKEKVAQKNQVSIYDIKGV